MKARSILVGLAALILPALVVAAAHAQNHRVGPSYLYPNPARTPGAVNPNIDQANIRETICSQMWSSESIRPSASHTSALKKAQLAAARLKDKRPSHYEADHLIPLDLGGHPSDPRNLWLQMWGTPNTPLTSRGPFPPHIIGASAKNAVEQRLHGEVCTGRMTLQEAQQIIATDWFKYYREHMLK